MADNTSLNSGAGGDTLRTDDVGGGVKIPVSKIHNGADGVDGGPITAANPFATQTQSGSLTALLIGGNATPVSLSNPLPITGSVGITSGGVNVSLSNPLPVTGSVGITSGGVNVSTSNPLPITGSVGITSGGVNVSTSNPLPVRSQSGSLTALLLGGSDIPVSLSNPVPVSGAVGVLVAGAQASITNPLPVNSQSGSLVSILLGSGVGPVAFGNPLPISGSIGITNGGVNVSRANPLTTEQSSEASGQVLSGSTVRIVNYLASDVVTSGSTQLIAPQGAGNMIRVLAAFAMASGTVIAKWQSTGSAGTIQNLSGYIPLTVNGGYVLPHNPHGWFQTRANEGLNLALNAAVNVGINLTWVLA